MILVKVPAWHRSLGLNPTPTPEFTHTPGQVAFTPDGRQLIVTTKAASNAIDVFAVGPLGGPAGQPTVNTEPDTVPFGIAFDGLGHLVVAEAGTNSVATFTVHRTATVTPVAAAATGQAATCWVTTDGTGNFYASNAGSATVSGYAEPRRLAPGAREHRHRPRYRRCRGDPDGLLLYVQTGVNGIVDGFAIAADGTLTPTGSSIIPNGSGGEGIVTS